MFRQIEICDFAYGDITAVAAYNHDGIAGRERPFLGHPQVKPRPPALQEPFDDVITVEFGRQLETRQAGLRDLETCGSDFDFVANADGLLRQSFDGEILAKGPKVRQLDAELPTPK